MKRIRPVAVKVALVLAALYVAACAALYWAMRQPPEVFGGVMKHVPRIAFLLLPFKPLWLSARAGTLKVGDAAPDFSLQTNDKKERIQLSSFRGQKPVVLVFGSYT